MKLSLFTFLCIVNTTNTMALPKQPTKPTSYSLFYFGSQPITIKRQRQLLIGRTMKTSETLIPLALGSKFTINNGDIFLRQTTCNAGRWTKQAPQYEPFNPEELSEFKSPKKVPPLALLCIKKCTLLNHKELTPEVIEMLYQITIKIDGKKPIELLMKPPVQKKS